MRYREQREKERKSGRKEEGERRVSSPSDPILTPFHFFWSSLFFASFPLSERWNRLGLLALVEDSPVAARKRRIKTMIVSLRGAEQGSLFCHI